MLARPLAVVVLLCAAAGLTFFIIPSEGAPFSLSQRPRWLELRIRRKNRSNDSTRLRSNQLYNPKQAPPTYGHLERVITSEAREFVLKQLRCVISSVDAAFMAAGIRYSVSDGTLLGMQRNGQFIPWDDDADARVDPSDWWKLKKYAAGLKRTQDGMYLDGPLLWDARLGTGAPDVQVTCGKSFNSSYVHMDVVVAWYVYGPWADATVLLEGPLVRANISGVEVSVAPPDRAAQVCG